MIGLGWMFVGRRRRRAIARITLADDLVSAPEGRAHRSLVVDGLRDWLAVCQAGGLASSVTLPSEAVAGIWRDLAVGPGYADLCGRAFGVVLRPRAAPVADDPCDEGVLRTFAIACRLEGIDARRPDRLPRLFHLDADLDHEPGLRWELTGDLPAVRRLSAAAPSTACAWPEVSGGHAVVRGRRAGFPV